MPYDPSFIAYFLGACFLQTWGLGVIKIVFTSVFVPCEKGAVSTTTAKMTSLNPTH